jgi:hypothetical protein
MEKVIKIIEEIQTFKTNEGVVCNPIKQDGYSILPLGWELELEKRKVEFEIIEILINQEEE